MYILASPLLVLLFVALAIIAAIKKAKIWTIVWVLLSVLLNLFSETFAYHPSVKDVENPKKENVLRVMAYNVHNGGEYLIRHEEDCAHELVKSIDSMKVDILLLCELDYNSNGLLIDTLRGLFPYNSYDVKEITDESTHNTYNASYLFSRYPICGISRLCYNFKDEKRGSESWLMEIELPSSIICFTACHFWSNIGYYKDSIDLSKKMFGNEMISIASLKEGYEIRLYEANALKNSLNRRNQPVIVAGDFNDIGGSCAVRTVMSDNLADAWWEGGFGYGHTFHGHNLFFRLDHILYSKEHFKLKGVKVLDDWTYSDHYPIVADFELSQ